MTKPTWPAVAVLAVIGAVVVALASLTDWGPGEILAAAGVLASLGGVQLVGNAVSGRVDQLAAQTTAQSEQLDTIQRQTNGLSTRERQDIAERAAAAAIAALREQESH